MNIVPQNYINVIKNVIEKGLNQNIKGIIDEIIDKYTIDNYVTIIKNIDLITNDISKEILLTTISLLDELFFKTRERKELFDSKGFKERGITTCFGYIRFKRRIYEYKDKTKQEDNYFTYVDRFLGLPKRDRFDPYVQSLVVDAVADNNSMIKAGRQVGELIGKKVNLEDYVYRNEISRQQVKNIILKAETRNIEPTLKELDTPEEIYVMADEKFVHNQREQTTDKTMIKSAIVFDNKILIGKKRNKLMNKHIISKIDDGIWSEVLNYIDYVYDEDKLKTIHVLGDGAKWIKQAISELKFSKNIKVIYSADKFHPSLAINNITKEKEEKNILYDYMINNRRKSFKIFCEYLKQKYPERISTIEEKMNYILNNWQYIQNSYKKCTIGCSMESHISHIYASIFSNRPKGYKKDTLKSLIKLRDMHENTYNIRQLFLDSLKPKEYQSFDDIPYQNKKTSNIPALQGKVDGLQVVLKNIIFN